MDDPVNTSFQWKDKAIGDAFNDLVDTFSGGANTRFYFVMLLVREMDTRAAAGDVAARKVLETVLQMSRLISLAVKYG